MLTKLPLSSAADHGGWRYEYLKWTFSLDSGRDRPSDAQDSLDPTSSFIAGRGARALSQDADNATLHWALEPVRRPKAGTGHGSAGRGRHWPALGTGVPAEGRHWPALGPAEGRHWPALGARRSAVLPAEGRRWLGRRPGTAARAVCARRSEQCAMYGARLSSMRTLYILLYILL